MLKKFLLLLFCWNCCVAQLPETDLWLFNVVKKKEKLSVQKGQNITNRKGYDNQPSFSTDGNSIYYVSIREDKQADIYSYSIGSKKNIRLTSTTESEYSPTLTSKKNTIACVTVLGDSSQVILTYDLKTGKPVSYPGNSSSQINSFDSVGYFTFLNSDTVLYYKLTQPHSLRAYSLLKKADVFLGFNPVRGFKAINRYEFIYGIKDSAKVTFYIYNALLSKANKYCEYNSLNEDIIWHKNLGLLKSEGPVILQFIASENKWQELFNFSGFGIKQITRFAFDTQSKRIVIVDNL